MDDDLKDRVSRYAWRNLLSKRRYIVGMIALPILVFLKGLMTGGIVTEPAWNWIGFGVYLASLSFIARWYVRLKKEDRDRPDWKRTLWVRPPTPEENPSPMELPRLRDLFGGGFRHTTTLEPGPGPSESRSDSDQP